MYDPNRRPGSSGRRYFTDAQFVPRGDAAPLPTAGGLASLNIQNTALANAMPIAGGITAAAPPATLPLSGIAAAPSAPAPMAPAPSGVATAAPPVTLPFSGIAAAPPAPMAAPIPAHSEFDAVPTIPGGDIGDGVLNPFASVGAATAAPFTQDQFVEREITGNPIEQEEWYSSQTSLEGPDGQPLYQHGYPTSTQSGIPSPEGYTYMFTEDDRRVLLPEGYTGGPLSPQDTVAGAMDELSTGSEFEDNSPLTAAQNNALASVGFNFEDGFNTVQTPIGGNPLGISPMHVAKSVAGLVAKGTPLIGLAVSVLGGLTTWSQVNDQMKAMGVRDEQLLGFGDFVASAVPGWMGGVSMANQGMDIVDEMQAQFAETNPTLALDEIKDMQEQQKRNVETNINPMTGNYIENRTTLAGEVQVAGTPAFDPAEMAMYGKAAQNVIDEYGVEELSGDYPGDTGFTGTLADVATGAAEAEAAEAAEAAAGIEANVSELEDYDPDDDVDPDDDDDNGPK
jgi:hypothetical protein